MMNAQNEPMTFEQAMNCLEAIVRKLEAGELPLDETVRLYEEGQRLRNTANNTSQTPSSALQSFAKPATAA
jgi:exodeoxyribonuclease VII small subunit